MGAGHLGIFTEAFSSICRTGLLGITDEQFNLGHWSFGYKWSCSKHAEGKIYDVENVISRS